MRGLSLLLGLSLLAPLTTRADQPRRTTEMTEVVTGNNRFAADLYAKLRERSGNLFFSPSSISTALAMTYAGAHAETAEAMARVLHFSLAGDKLHPAFASLNQGLAAEAATKGYRLSIANRLWGQKGYHFLPEFLAITRDVYGAELAEVDFAHQTEEARRTINAWVEKQTQDKIQDLIPSGVIDPLTRLVLTNAIYFKGDWSTPFAKDATKDEPFLGVGSQSITVPLMTRQGSYKYWEGEDLKVVELPYAGGDLSMAILLPDKVDGLPDLESKLSAEAFDRWMSGLHARPVRVSLPRFKIASQFSLADTLKAMGMKLAFDQDRADFSRMASQEELYISAVVHKAFVEVNEEGTEAAAATGVVMAPRMAARPAPPAIFRADHPFLFLIRDSRTGSVLFLGRIVNPLG